ncbi:HU family DNA-binding protein [Hydrogenivirga sp. 128-5-R1-1]|uniref:HU family DNA-binding protein n=1 Tax=Hydrogenivirga sp. 128-5-R1-1 TaxID=392423 RepID=UPI00015F2787|nr:HU family DNA-binding protein [Hydrogenivirga sp. 128-5-R1-1]EDP73462.1 Histone-like DNA-binding protein [Hydrogenivirga sp. 128-5-R1-1]
MTKIDIVEWILDNKDINLTKKDIKIIVDELFSLIENELKNGQDGKKIQISGFGTFFVKKRKAKVGRNPRTNEEKIVPERLGVSFKPGKKLINEINSI